MAASERLDRLTNTFKADRLFFNALLNSSVSDKVCESLVLKKWSSYYLEPFQNAIDRASLTHVSSRCRKDGAFHSIAFLGMIIKDIGLLNYLIVRGQTSGAGFVLRRALEHVGVFTHIWFNESTITALNDPHSLEYKHAFQSEHDRNALTELQKRGIKKRFEKCLTADAISLVYEQLSDHDVHGGSQARLFGRSKDPGCISCAFSDRSQISETRLLLLFAGTIILCCEIVNIVMSCEKYGKLSRRTRDGLAFLGGVLSLQGERTSY